MKQLDIRDFKKSYSFSTDLKPKTVWSTVYACKPLNPFCEAGIPHDILNKVEELSFGWTGWAFSANGDACFLFENENDAMFASIVIGEQSVN